MVTQDEGRDDGVSNRRGFLAATGVGLAGLAGCSSSPEGDTGNDGNGDGDGGGNGSGSDGGTDSEGGGEPVDSTFTAGVWTNPSNTQYNSYNLKNYPGLVALLLHDQLARYDHVSGEYVPLVVSEWNIDLDAMTVTLGVADGYAWQDGTPVRAKDLHGMVVLDRLVNDPYTEYLDGARVVDDRTVELQLASKVNPAILKLQLFSSRLDVRYETYEEFITRAEEASTEEKRTAVQEDLTTLKLNEPDSNGPFAYEQSSPQRVLLTKHGAYPKADSINFPEYEFRYISGNQENWSALKSNITDGTTGFTPEKVAKGFPDSIVYTQHPNWGGFGLSFKHSDEVFGDTRVRKALAYALDRSVIAENSGGDKKTPANIPTGIPGNFSGQADEWLGESKSEFSKYEQNPEKSASLMREAGYSKEEGTWVRDNGDPVTVPILVQAGWSDWVSAAQTAVSNLNQVGFNAEMRTTPNLYNRVWVKGDFRVGAIGWGGGRPYPYFGLRFALAGNAIVDSAKYPAELSVPPLGDPDGEPRSVKPREKVEALATEVDSDRADQLIRELAWIVNRDLPLLPIQEKVRDAWTDSGDWDIPAKDAHAMQLEAPYWWLPRVGKLQAKTE
jgi:peptide/nickel transport system substrate-binding protein